MSNGGPGTRGPPGLTLVWDERVTAYDLGPTHPFRMESRRLAVRLLEAWRGFLGSTGVERVDSLEPAAASELSRFHTADYLHRVEAASEAVVAPPLDAGDTPAFPGCYPAAARVVAGTLAAVEAAARGTGRRAISPSGGLHHAHPSRASGFCIFNDVAVALRHALDGPLALDRVAYVDLDAHHGDGVMYGFYGDGRVLDLDFHQDGRTIFPGTGRTDETGSGDGAGLKVNVPLPPGAGDEAVLPLFRALVPEMLRAFRPNLIVLQHGMDAHADDRLAQLRYTPAAYAAIDAEVTRLADELCAGRLVITGGGGYRAGNVALGLARAALIAAGRPPDGAELPEGWRAEFATVSGEAAPRTFDPPVEAVRSPWSPERTEQRLGELERALGRRFPRSA